MAGPDITELQAFCDLKVSSDQKLCPCNIRGFDDSLEY